MAKKSLAFRLKLWAILILPPMFLFGCDTQDVNNCNLSHSYVGAPIIDDPNMSYVDGEPFVVAVHRYDTLEELEAAWNENKSEKHSHLTNVCGFAGWDTSRVSLRGKLMQEPIVSICEIHVLQPSFEKDHIFRSWGHELNHCIEGAFHK